MDLLNFVYTERDKGNHVIAIFLDFSKAFDVIPHSLFLTKLSALNFSDSAIKLIQSYLTGRSQQVVIDGVMSKSLNVDHGVPQGSILGPLLFNIFINDLNKCMKHGKIVSYVDDTTLLYSGKNLLQLVQKNK